MSQDKKDSFVPVEVSLLEHNLKTDLAVALDTIINQVADGVFIKNLSPARREEFSEKVIQIMTDSFPEIIREIRQRAKEMLVVFAERDAMEKEMRKRPGVN